MKFKLPFVFFCIVAVFLASFPIHAQSSSQQDTLNQYVSDLQKNPDDQALRKKIIKLAQEMMPAPAIPEEARRHYVKACTLLEDAKQPSDSADAAGEFRQALLAAPWWSEAYMKMGLALETAQRYDDAIASLKLFMASNPQGEMLRKTQDEIYKIEARQEKAVKDKEKAAEKEADDKKTQQEDAAAKKAREQEEFLRKINGARYVCHYPGPVEDINFTIDVLGDTLTGGQVKTRSTDPGETKVGVWEKTCDTYKIDGRSLQCYMMGNISQSMTGIITDDGSTITIITRTSNGYESRLIYKRER